MKPAKLICPFIFLLVNYLPIKSVAQQGNIWYFGIHAGLNFNTSPPSPLVDGALDTKEGSSSISDDNGNILFYTDGSTVYNKNHQPMPNGTGLLGNYSSAQSAIIIPKPGSNTLYYLFTAAEYGDLYQKGYNYNVIDMSSGGGLGDVVEKNILLYAPGTEKLNAIRHANGIDVWVMTKVTQSDIFKAFKIDCNGLNPNPIISISGNIISPEDGYSDAGVFKFSPDGKKLCQTFGSKPLVVQLSVFDNNTGIVSNSIQWSYSDSSIGNYCTAEFSPNSKLLYTSFTAQSPVISVYLPSVKLFQYDVTIHAPSNIISTETLLFQDQQLYGGLLLGWMGLLQIAPDNKIYLSRPGLLKIDVINNPDIAGTGCNYQQAAVDLGGRVALLGLPTFMPNLFINQQSNINFTLSSDCSTVNFFANTSISGPVSWQWDFGDGSTSISKNPVHTYSNSGNIYTVKLKVISSAACNGFFTVEKDVNLNRVVPIPGFYIQSECGNPTISFFDTSLIEGGTGINYRLWEFGDGGTSSLENPQHKYSSIGNYTVKLTVGNTNTCGGNTFISTIVTVETKPIPNFTITGGCAGSPVKFRDSSIINTGTISEWLWDFGDSNMSRLQNPEHTYSTPNTYIVTLKVKSETGCWSNQKQKDVALSSKPLAKIGWKNTCVDETTFFADSSIISTGDINAWYWDYGDGNTSIEQNRRHVYTTPGKYIIKFIATTSTSCNSDTLINPITIGSKPIANFLNSDTCGLKTVYFKDISINSVGDITEQNWSFGDGQLDTIINPQHTYANFTNYFVKLVVSTSLGCTSDTATKIVAVNARPFAKFNVKGGCINQPTIFNDSSDIESGSIVKLWWSLGDGTNNSGLTFMHTYNNAVFYDLKLVVLSDKNCLSDTAYKTITIEEKPVAKFTLQNSCVGNFLVLGNNTTIGNGSIDSYFWDFGNGFTSTEMHPNFAYNNFGDLEVKLTASSKNGCIADTVSNPVRIESYPVIDFDFGATCTGKPILFKNLSNNSFGNITEWDWNFGNTVSSIKYEPVYTYTQYGNYAVKLSASTANKCASSKTMNISISKVNIFAGKDTIVAVNQPLRLSAFGAINYIWTPNFNLSNNTIYNPIAILSNDFSYYLQGTTTAGCIGYDTIKIKVYKGPEIYVPSAFTPNGDGNNDNIKPIIPGVLSLEYFSIYNRWGQQVFSTGKIGIGWDGKIKGLEQPTGAYLWICKIKDYLGKIIERKGNFLLIR